MQFKVSNHIKDIKSYEPGKPLKELERELNISQAIKLASNENPLGFSSLAKKAVQDNFINMNQYPESSAYSLRTSLADKYKVKFGNVVVGNGSDDIISLLSHGFLNPGDEAVIPTPSFLMYEISVKIAKGVPVKVPLTDFAIDLDQILQAITPKTRMIFITNPFNPTGSTVSSEKFAAFKAQVPDNILIVVDEAYIEFVRDDTVYNSLKDPLNDPRIVSLRTFSKAYGLAGFRVGYGLMNEGVAEILNRIRQPFNVNTLAQVAAEAALDDEEFLQRTIELTHKGLDFLANELSIMGLTCLPTQSNFVMMNVKIDATVVFNEMLKRGVIIRSMKSYGFDTFVRVTAGTFEENKAFLAALDNVLKSVNS